MCEHVTQSYLRDWDSRYQYETQRHFWHNISTQSSNKFKQSVLYKNKRLLKMNKLNRKWNACLSTRAVEFREGKNQAFWYFYTILIKSTTCLKVYPNWKFCNYLLISLMFSSLNISLIKYNKHKEIFLIAPINVVNPVLIQVSPHCNHLLYTWNNTHF